MKSITQRLLSRCRSENVIVGKCSASTLSFESIERAAGRHAANMFINSMEKNSKLIDTPTICIGDPANASSWEWVAGLDNKPQFSSDDMLKMSKNVNVDAFKMVEKDITTLSGGIKELLGSDHPVLESCAKYFFEIDGGKKIRPTMVLAVSYALNSQSRSRGVSQTPVGASPSQKRLAEIIEMIHTASLFHDDVIDKADTRRGVPSVNQSFGNKLAILGGDFLLSRASICSARLRNLAVVELLSTIIEHLVKGEVMQMRPSSTGTSALEYYLRKNFYKTASLMGHSCLSAAVLGEHSEDDQRACYLYGTYVGQAFQLVDDALDFEGSTATIGKVPLADLKSGLATAPTLYAADEFPQLIPLINRKFESPGDIEEAFELVQRSSGLARTRDLAQVHAEKAIEAITRLEPSPARDALVALACTVVVRKH